MYVRPESLRLLPANAPAPGAGQLWLAGAKVRDALYSGGDIDYVVDLGGEHAVRHHTRQRHEDASR
jgi:hypothetical protein